MVLKSETLDKIKGYLTTAGFSETEKYPGLWICGERPHILLVDLKKTPIEFAVSDGISRWTEGHGILKMDEVQAVIAGIILQNEPKPEPKPEPEMVASHVEPIPKKNIHVHIHVHLHISGDAGKVTADVDTTHEHEEYYLEDEKT